MSTDKKISNSSIDNLKYSCFDALLGRRICIDGTFLILSEGSIIKNTMYNFTEFTNSGGRFKPYISLGKKSGFGLSSGFTNKYKDDLAGVVGVKMFYDESKSVVAFKFLKHDEDGMISVKLRDKGGYIAAQSFIGKFDINQDAFAGQFTPKIVEDPKFGKLFVIDLTENIRS